MNAPQVIRVMLVDDSAIIRGLVSRALKETDDIIIVGTAINGAQAIASVVDYNPDIIVLDIEMPQMDGLTALPELTKLAPNAHVIMASTLTERNAEISLRALSLGASDYLTKPSARQTDATEQFFYDLKVKIRALAQSKPKHIIPAITPVRAQTPLSVVSGALQPVKHVSALAIASSTGGPQALQSLFSALNGCTRNIPVFITQHMPPTFTAILAEHLSKAAGLPCHEARDNQRVEAGHIYLAPGDFHMQPERTSEGVVVRINQNAPENFCRPAADPMIRNLSAIYGNQLLVAVLTGMGHDGLQGARKALEAGAEIIAQDQETCVVWGMPRAVTEAKIVTQALPLLGLADYITRAVAR